MANDKNPYSLRAIFQRMELDLIASFKRTFSRHKNEELKEGFQWEQWQLIKLRNLVSYRNANRKIIESYSDSIEEVINDNLINSFKTGERRVEKDIRELILYQDSSVSKKSKSIKDIIQDMLNIPKASMELNFFGVNEKKLQALQQSVADDIKQAQQSVLRHMDDIYRKVIFKSQYMMQAGAKTLYEAIDMATADFLEKGINSITFKDGRKVNISSYAEMSLRTSSQRATFLGEGKKRDEWGIHTVVVSAHANTCEKCLPWQGKILIDDVFSHGTKADGEYKLLSEAMRAGLLHPQCRHTVTIYFPGITKLPEAVDNKKALENYKQEQKQRYMERQIRKWKRVQNGSLDNNNVQTAKKKVAEWQSRLRDHLEKNPQLRRNYNREKV